jgi:hypothetical protein
MYDCTQLNLSGWNLNEAKRRADNRVYKSFDDYFRDKRMDSQRLNSIEEIKQRNKLYELEITYGILGGIIKKILWLFAKLKSK